MANNVGLNSVTMAPPFQNHLFEPSLSSASSPVSQPPQPSSRSPTTSGSSNSTGAIYEGPWSWEHFPSSFRTRVFAGNIKILNENTLNDFFEDEYSLKRFDIIPPVFFEYIGQQAIPSCLTTQLQLRRNIVLTKALDMHLTWDTGKIFIKPLPRYILEDMFWVRGLSQEIRKIALGFLYTYACLITGPEDFRIALEKNLLPKDDAGNDPEWASWRVVATEVLGIDTSEDIHPRFRLGELQLEKLNRMYGLHHPGYYYDLGLSLREFMANSFSGVTSVTVYIALVLAAMQVGLATNTLKDNTTFHRASCGFAVFSILNLISVGTNALVVVLVRQMTPHQVILREYSLNMVARLLASSYHPHEAAQNHAV
ncbi:hypothetical protein F4811DRAFT_555175 [Daldinia bambusicola]|nr:hypothetical protein F4811DRAFT_555175 [Daldinia bambusicola]